MELILNEDRVGLSKKCLDQFYRKLHVILGVEALKASMRSYIEKLLFPGAPGQRRRHMRFFLLAVLLAVICSAGFGAILYLLNRTGRL
jgi:hypothetical protein